MANYPWHWDHFFDKYPYTDFHELNLDWLIHAIKYWYVRIDYAQQAIATGSEDHNKYYSQNYSKGDLIWWRDEFYRLTKDVSAGDDIDCHSLEHISVEDLLDEETAARIAADDAERAARIAADNAEQAARIAADNAEQAARIAADNALGDRIDKEITDRTNADNALGERIDKEITDRTNADNNLQQQITSNDTDIANLQSCCEKVQGDITNIDNRVTNNTNNINNITNQINNGTSANGVRDTNTLTQLTYHEWRGTVWGGDTGITQLAGMQEAAKKVDEIVAAGGHAELCRIQRYGLPTNDPANMGLQGSEFLNRQSAGAYRYQTSGGSSIDQDCSITDTTISQDSSKCIERSWYFSYNNGSGSTWSYSKADLTGTVSGGWFWQYRLIYQTADYISA